MIAHWMLYVAAVGALLSLGALAMERAMRASRLPQRWVWAAAMVLTLALPAAARWLPRAPEGAAAARTAGEVEGTRIRLADLPAAAADAGARLDVAALDGPLAMAWAGLSTAAVLALLGAAGVLARRRRRWRAAEVDGVPVLLSPATGPAVVGLFRSRIVLPAWVMDADPAERALLLEHEREHVRAGDPRLLALGLAAVALAPWSPAAWYQLRRLRLAMEVDCDARVLARRADVRAYGTLLLEVGRRAQGGGWIAAAAFSEPVSFLERRIRIMTAPRARRPRLRAGGFGIVALALVAVACETPGPVQTSPSAPSATRMESVRTDVTTDGLNLPSGVRISRAAVRSAIEANYPEVLGGAATDSATLMFVLAPDGSIERHERVQLRRMGPPPANAAEAQGRWRETSGLSSQEMGSTLVDVLTFPPGAMGRGRVEVLWIRRLDPASLRVTTGRDTVRVSGAELQPAGPSQMRTSTGGEGQGQMITAGQAAALVRRYMPEVARNGTTAAFVWLMSDASGTIIGHGDAATSEALNARVNDLDGVQVFKGESVVLNGHEVPVVYARIKS